MNVTWDELDGRGLSGRLWKKFAQDGVLVFQDSNVGIGVFDDFLHGVGLVSSNVGGWNGYKTFEDSSCSALTMADTAALTTANAKGVLKLLTETTDNNSVTIAGGYGVGGPFRFPATLALAKELIFEARWAVSSVGASVMDSFVGMAGTGAAANNVPFGDDDSLANIDMLGFQLVGHASAPHIDLVWKRTGQTAGSSSNVVLTSTAAGVDLAADVFIKTGFRLNAERGELTVWINGREVAANKIAGSTLYPSGTLLGTWPNLGMHLAACVKNMTTTASYVTLDWWAAAQVA